MRILTITGTYNCTPDGHLKSCSKTWASTVYLMYVLRSPRAWQETAAIPILSTIYDKGSLVKLESMAWMNQASPSYLFVHFALWVTS